MEEWDTVPIFGVPTKRRAQVIRLNGFSAHADRNDLLAYVRAIHPHPRTVFVVHGEERQSLAFAMAYGRNFLKWTPKCLNPIRPMIFEQMRRKWDPSIRRRTEIAAGEEFSLEQPDHRYSG